MVSWSKNQTVEFKAKEDSEYTGKLTEIDVDFEVQGRDPKYNNMTMPTLKVYLWDDRSITLGKEEKKPPDYALLIAIIVAVSAALCFMASVIRKRIQKHREWKLHHDLLSTVVNTLKIQVSISNVTFIFCLCDIMLMIYVANSIDWNKKMKMIMPIQISKKWMKMISNFNLQIETIVFETMLEIVYHYMVMVHLIVYYIHDIMYNLQYSLANLHYISLNALATVLPTV